MKGIARWVKACSLSTFGLLQWGCGAPDNADSVPHVAHSIAFENEFAGSRGFEVTQPALANELEAYASLVSASAGDTLDVFVNVDEADDVRFELYRLGYYQGRGGRLLQRGREQRISPQPACPVDATTGLIECAWGKAFSIDIDAGFVSGYYLVKLISARGFETRVPFVVREAVPRAPVLVQASVNTWQAYNYWGGTSLYYNLLPEGSLYTQVRAFRVSYDRPYVLDAGAGILFEQEAWMAHFLEKKGYDVAYVTNIDLDREPELLLNRKIAFSIGHDEYNSVRVRSGFEAARDNGVSLAFLTANAGYWRVRQDPSTSGESARIVTCYKNGNLDPQRDSIDTTVLFRQYPFARPESQLEGVMYQPGSTPETDLPLLVAKPDSWLFEGANVGPLERLGNALGPEWDELSPDSPADTELVLDSPAIRKDGGFVRSHAALHYPTDHSFVFGAGTIDWVRNLGHPDFTDQRLQRVTENLIARAGVPPREWTVPAPPAEDTPTASEISVIAGTGEAGFVDGPGDSAQFNAPSGITLGPDGALYVTEVRNHSVRRIDPDGTVLTIAGCNVRGTLAGGFRDGPGRRACFDTPSAIVAAADGTLFISDTGNNRIRSIGPGYRVRTWAGVATGGLIDSPNPKAARFLGPRGIALGSDGSIYVAEPRHGAIRRIAPDGAVSTVITDVVGLGSIAVGEDDSIYFASLIEGGIWKLVDGQAVPVANPSHVPGDRIGEAAHARFRPGEGLLLDGNRLIIADMGNYRIRELDLAAERVSTLAGDGRAGLDIVNAKSAHIVLPRGITRYRDGYAVADTGNHRILYVKR